MPADGSQHPTRPDPKPVLAEHCFGITREGRWYPFTRLTTRALWINGGTFIANVEGHREDGSLAELEWPYRAYVLTLAGAQPVPAVLADDHPLRLAARAVAVMA